MKKIFATVTLLSSFTVLSACGGPVESSDEMNTESSESSVSSVSSEVMMQPLEDGATEVGWSITLSATTPKSPAGSECKGGAGKGVIEEGKFTATITTDWGYDLTATANVDDDGTLYGGIAKGDVNAGGFDGMISGNVGEGTWKDAFGCEGTFAMQKM